MKYYATAFGVVSILPRSTELLRKCNGVSFDEYLAARGVYEYTKTMRLDA